MERRRCAIIVLCWLSAGVVGCGGVPRCGNAAEPARLLDLNTAADRAYLTNQIAAVQHEAAEYGAWAAAHPPADASHVSIEALRQHATTYCENLLTEALVAKHGVDLLDIDRYRQQRPAPQP
jgi:hypothetical protein